VKKSIIGTFVLQIVSLRAGEMPNVCGSFSGN